MHFFSRETQHETAQTKKTSHLQSKEPIQPDDWIILVQSDEKDDKQAQMQHIYI